MSLNKKPAFVEEIFAGNSLVKVLKFFALFCIFGSFIFAVGAIATRSREYFGFRYFVAYFGLGLISGVVIFELAEVIRWLEKLYKRFDLYDKIDR